MGKMEITTLCYIERDGQYLMLHRTGKKQDGNQGKWIGIGGHVEAGESPEDCLLREVREETGLILTDWRFRGLVTFVSDQWPQEYMCLYTAKGFAGGGQPGDAPFSCREGELAWMDRELVRKQKIWDGDRIFLRLLEENHPFFSLKLEYRGDRLDRAVLDGRELELFGLCGSEGSPTGHVADRETVHAWGLMHPTAHVWVVRRKDGAKGWELLLQKRSARKDSFPGCLDTSSAGHIRAGEEALPSALRELAEELGIQAEPEELEEIGSFDSGEIRETFRGKPFHDREISRVYVYSKPVRAEELKLQKEEVDAVEWVPYETCLSWVKAKDPRICTNLESLELLGNYFKKRNED